MLAVAGCRAGISAAPHGPAVPDGAAEGSARSGPLLIEPGAGFIPVYRLIADAQHSIDVTMYELTDTAAENDLAAAVRRGVAVRVILDRREQSLNAAAFAFLRGHGVKVVWSSPGFRYTHQKTLILDGSEAVIMTANLTSRYYPTSRDFLILDTSRADVSAITAVFNADLAYRSVHPGAGGDLVWSPGAAPQKLLALIDGATSSLLIYSEEMGDARIEHALIAAARRGVQVRVCGENQAGEYDRAYATLAAAGIRISYYSSAAGFYIHGKVIEADYGTPRARVFIGSENFSSTSLTENRELGLITADPAVLAAIAATFAVDFRSGQPWTSG